jgi:hypothetical protein
MIKVHCGCKFSCSQWRQADLDLPMKRTLPFLSFMFRFTVIWESIIVIIREKRAKVIELIWERVEPRAA